MGNPILYYSLSGHTAQHAKNFAAANGGDLIEIKPVGKMGKFKAYVVGGLNAIRGKAMPIKPIETDLSQYSEVVLFTPVWANGIAPPMTAAIEQLSRGTKVSLHLVSGSGKIGKERITASLDALGLEIRDYEDIK